jgi:hypothetical protein
MKKYKIIEDSIEYDIEEFEEFYIEGHLGVNKYWNVNGLLHRENGPAIELADGYKEWQKHGKCHREDGPAKIFPNGLKEYYLNDKYYDVNSIEELIIASIIT